MKRCGDPHPESQNPCILPETSHSHHGSKEGESWPNTMVQEALAKRPTRRGGKGRGASKPSDATIKKVRDMSGRARPETHVNPINDHRPPSHGPSPESVAAWDADGWVDRTFGTLTTFLRDRHEPFTTPEHFWPLIEAPREMRAMSRVVQRALRQNILQECGAKRLKDTYRTRDGVEFAMNKIVPVYQSLLVDSRKPWGLR